LDKQEPNPVQTFVDSVVERLCILKEIMTYSEMEKRTGVDSTLLCRYVTGSVRPSKPQAQLILERLKDAPAFRNLVEQRMLFKEGGYLDMHEVLGDPTILKWIASEVYFAFSNKRIDRVVTAASSGIPLATAIALSLDADLTFATPSKTSGKGAYYESEISTSNPAEVFALYVPVSWIKKGEKILIVDDVATTGRTMSALITLIKDAGTVIQGIAVLASRGNRWREQIAPLLEKDVPVFVLFQFSR
jgi:purine operon repressor